MAKSCSCNDFTRSQFLRRGVAAAGKGLPGIEPGMPLPAGTGLDRRTFLLRSAGAALSVYGASMLGPRHFEEGIAQAMAAGGTEEPVLVSIFMEGGWDALSVLAPVGEDKYRKLRPTLGLAEGSGKVFSEDTSLMWHPAATGLAELHEEGKVTTFPAIGYQPADESHFTSRHYWEVGQLDAQARSGLDGPLPGLGRRTAQPTAGTFAGLLAGASARHSEDACGSGLLARRLHDVGQWPERTGERPALETFGALGALSAPSPAYAQARAASYDTGLVLEKMAGFVQSEKESGENSRHLPKRGIRGKTGGARRDAAYGDADQVRFVERRGLL